MNVQSISNPNDETTQNAAEKKWAIVGGGMLGLTLAMRMAKAGHNVTLIEAAPVLGGLASVWNLGDIVWDRHYHVTLLSDSRVRNVMAIPTLRYSESLPQMNSSVDGLYVVNSSYILKGNLNVNESITIAEDAMDSVLKTELRTS